MTFVAFHGALRVNTNPLNPGLGVVETINLALDHPANIGGLRPFEWIKIVQNMISDYQLTEQVSQSSTRRRSMKGLGVRMRWNIEFSMFPVKPQEWYGTLGHLTSSAMDEPMQNIINALGVGASGFNDGTSKYLWFSPNYQWTEPEEQWFRVVPDGNPGFSQPGKSYSTIFKLAVMTAKNYKTINWRYYRRGFQFVGPGTGVSVFGVGNTQVSGVGATTFLSDFINGDRIIINGETGVVDTVQSDTSMTLLPGFPTVSGPWPVYNVVQASCPTWAVPVYTVTGFGPASGWGISPWGDNWGQ
jgi:hypothetical protein